MAMYATDDLKNNLRKFTVEGNWEKVIDSYKRDETCHTTIISINRGTAVHVAVNAGKKDDVKLLLDAIMEHHKNGLDQEEALMAALKKRNEAGNTPLHLAASKGYTGICKYIVGKNGERRDLIKAKNVSGETPLFLAALSGQQHAFAYLSDVYQKETESEDDTLEVLTRDDFDSILHCAIRREFFDLAIIILHQYPILIGFSNKDSFTPLKVLATRPSAFWSGSKLSWWKRLLYKSITVEALDVKRVIDSYLNKEDESEEPEHNGEHLQIPPCYSFPTELRQLAVTIGRFFGLIQQKCSEKDHDQQQMSKKAPSSDPQTSNGLKEKEIKNEERQGLREDSDQLQILIPLPLSDQHKKEKKDHVQSERSKNDPSSDPQPSCVSADQKENKNEEQQQGSEKDYEASHVPPNYATCLQFVKHVYMHTLGLYGVGTSEIKIIKQKHKWGDQLLRAFMEKPFESYMTTGGQPTDPDEYDEEAYAFYLQTFGDSMEDNGTLTTPAKVDRKERPFSTAAKDIDETPFLTAAKNGIIEMVNLLLEKIPSAIDETTSDNKNVLLVAVENRQPLIVETLISRKENFQNLRLGVDDDENTVLHLAAKSQSSDEVWKIAGDNDEKTLSRMAAKSQSSDQVWKIAGSAMQMMWEIKWFQYIKDQAPPDFSFRSNKKGETPGEIFKTGHENLVDKSSEWLKDTSESCSLVAALIAGVSFATASTVPGGNNSDTGKPALEGQPAFDVFALASLVGLCFSVMALIMFLSILTSRKQAKDFRRNLPLKLLLGLSSLFVSIAAMLVSFCSGHFFVIKDKYKSIMFPLYAATCLPVTFYAIAQFPLYIDLLTAIFTDVPEAGDKGDAL